jgi:hypothetical protein
MVGRELHAVHVKLAGHRRVGPHPDVLCCFLDRTVADSALEVEYDFLGEVAPQVVVDLGR